MSPPPENVDPTGGHIPDTEPFFRPLRPGQVIAGRYRIKELIARGGQALVYLAEQETLERRVALKVMSMTDMDLDPEEGRFLERFQLEARTLAALDHPSIVRVYDFGQVSSSAVYFAMEFIDGEPMSRVLRTEEITRGEALRLMQQIIRALHYAHERGVVHRDMKFTNVLIGRDQQGQRVAKVVDFGIAKVNDSGDTLTRQGDVLGSPHFMSPEQISGEVLDHRTDVYSVGIMLYHIITGTYPFRADNPQGILAGHLMRKPLPMTEAAPNQEIAPVLEALVLRCLSKTVSDRFESMLVLADALSPFVDDPNPVEIQTPDGYRSGSSRIDSGTLAGVKGERIPVSRGQWVLMGALISSIIGILGLTGYVLWLSFQDSPSDRSDSRRDNDETEVADEKDDEAAQSAPADDAAGTIDPSESEAATASDPLPDDETHSASEHLEEESSARPDRPRPTSPAVAEPLPSDSESVKPTGTQTDEPPAEESDPLDFSIDEMEVIDPWEQ